MENNIKEELEKLDLRNITTRQLSFLALFIAFVALATYFIRIPGLNTSYYNLGEVVIFTLALVFGKKAGLIAGALGSALIDLIVAPIWAPFTFVIKGLEAWVVGSLAEEGKLSKNLLAVLIGGHIMIIGYAITVWILYSWPAVIPEIGGNYGQAGLGAIVALPLARQFNKYFRK